MYNVSAICVKEPTANLLAMTNPMENAFWTGQKAIKDFVEKPSQSKNLSRERGNFVSKIKVVPNNTDTTKVGAIFAADPSQYNYISLSQLANTDVPLLNLKYNLEWNQPTPLGTAAGIDFEAPIYFSVVIFSQNTQYETLVNNRPVQPVFEPLLSTLIGTLKYKTAQNVFFLDTSSNQFLNLLDKIQIKDWINQPYRLSENQLARILDPTKKQLGQGVFIDQTNLTPAAISFLNSASQINLVCNYEYNYISKI